MKKRYGVSKFDSSTYQVVDNEQKNEVCVCGNYEGDGKFKGRRDAQKRAKLIAKLLNEWESEAC